MNAAEARMNSRKLRLGLEPAAVNRQIADIEQCIKDSVTEYILVREDLYEGTAAHFESQGFQLWNAEPKCRGTVISWELKPQKVSLWRRIFG